MIRALVLGALTMAACAPPEVNPEQPGANPTSSPEQLDPSTLGEPITRAAPEPTFAPARAEPDDPAQVCPELDCGTHPVKRGMGGVILVCECWPQEACQQRLVYAVDPDTGACLLMPTPCDVPNGWSQIDTCAS